MANKFKFSVGQIVMVDGFIGRIVNKHTSVRGNLYEAVGYTEEYVEECYLRHLTRKEIGRNNPALKT